MEDMAGGKIPVQPNTQVEEIVSVLSRFMMEIQKKMRCLSDSFCLESSSPGRAVFIFDAQLFEDALHRDGKPQGNWGIALNIYQIITIPVPLLFYWRFYLCSS